ncbi:MAG: carbamoyl-phosphate synthase large subunit [bacterium]
MPKRTDIKKILIIGSGPIVIGQACEFDYSGTQSCKVLKEDGYEIILINSNPATIMTDPQIADKTYIEPINIQTIEKIIAKERPDAILPTLGGQTGLNIAVELAKAGILDKYGVEMIGANLTIIEKAENRNLFKQAMQNINLDLPQSDCAHNLDEAIEIAIKIGFPVIIRPAFTLGGSGSSIAYNLDEFKALANFGLSQSPISEILIEESVIGWKEYELEVMRDKNDNVVIVCSIENFDAMGIHTGDSITVAPSQTLTDKEYQNMRNASIAIMKEIGVSTGGSNIQFAINPINGRMVVIEMNPRVSRSSALASKATGFPIAKIAAKLAVGYTLEEIPNDITKKTPSCFEPSIDYVVVKIPRWTFEKFPDAEPTLTTQMKSVGEVMAIGRTFKEALQKGIRSLEQGQSGLEINEKNEIDKNLIIEKLKIPNPDRIFYIKYAFENNFSLEKIADLTKIDKWFLFNIQEIVNFENEIKKINFCNSENEIKSILEKAKKMGFSDCQIANFLNKTEIEIRNLRKKLNILPTFKLVDTCAAEFPAYTPYYYSTYEQEDEVQVSNKKKIVILGAGPNRIGQGIEFDYCCVHAAFALKEIGYETIMINSNPETVSTDYDTSDKLYFEPIALENILDIVEKENPDGVIVQFGGQTPLKLSLALKKNGVKIIGTTPENIDIAEDRKKFNEIIHKLNLKQPESGTAFSYEEAINVVKNLKYPILVRPSYVLGGRAMEIVYDDKNLFNYIHFAVKASSEHPILIDRFLEDAIELDVDAISDGEEVVIAGIMEHIEEAGIHSGDSACILPPFSIKKEIIEEIKQNTVKLTLALNIIGLINIQYAIKDNIVYVLEVNPRASRTIPFVSKATNIQWAKIATWLMVGKKIKDLGIKEVIPSYYSTKEVVMPFIKFSNVDIILGPEMRSTGEVMGIDKNVNKSFAKALLAAGSKLPLKGNVFISVADKDKSKVINIAKELKNLNYNLFSTEGTANFLKQHNILVKTIAKIQEGHPNVIDYMKNNQIDFVINTPIGKGPKTDEFKIRRQTILNNLTYVTTITGAKALVDALKILQKEDLEVMALQEYYCL